MKFPDNLHQQEETKVIICQKSIFPNPSAINAFMMAIGNHRKSSLVTPPSGVRKETKKKKVGVEQR